MSLRFDAMRLVDPVTGCRLRWGPAAKCSLTVVVSTVLAACGGGGGADPAELVVQTLPSGISADLGGVFGGPAILAVRRPDGLVLKSVEINASSAPSSFTISDPGRAPVGTVLEVAIERHPRNQLCAVSTTGLQVGQGQGVVTLRCAPALLNDTGLTECATPLNEPACRAQDAQSGRDAERARLTRRTLDASLKQESGFDFTRICNSGAEEGSAGCQLSANPVVGALPGQWACTRDHVTGLLWLVRATPAATFSAATLPSSPGAAFASVCNVNVSDWRLPAANELASLINSGKQANQPAVDTTFFPNLADPDKQRFWTASRVREANRLFVDLRANGAVSLGGETDLFHVVWVSGAQAEPPGYNRQSRHVASSDGAILTDRLTGLAWSVCSLGRTHSSSPQLPCSGTAAGYSWSQALDAVAVANTTRRLGFADWRLPNRAELASLLDFEASGDVLIGTATALQGLRDDSAALDGPAASYWTSTAPLMRVGDQGNPCGFPLAKPYQVNFGEGSVFALPEKDCSGEALFNQLRVRLVRDAR